MKTTSFSRRSIIILLSIIVPAVFLISCSSKQTQNTPSNKIRIAGQYGLAYAPLEIMKHEKILEKNLPGLEVEWKQLGNTAAIREAMLSDGLDAGFMAIPPFLIGWDKGMEWKIATGLSSSPVSLVTYKENIKSIADFTKDDRIAMPQPGSIQDILLSMASEKEFKDPRKLDGLVVTLSHPDGMNALLAKKDITAHFTAPPYLNREIETPGFSEILKGNDIMGGDFTFIAGVTTVKFHDKNPKVYSALIKSIDQSIDFINNNRKEAARILSGVYEMSEDDILKYLAMEGVVYSNKVRGINKFAEFMKRNGYISKAVNNIKDIAWEETNYEN